VEFIEKKGDVVELGLVRSEPRRRARRGGTTHYFNYCLVSNFDCLPLTAKWKE
jgi:hypothetical protein